MARLQHYAWPGNVRELHNVIERLLIMVHDHTVTAEDVSFIDDGGAAATVPGGATAGPVTALAEARDAFERGYILRVLAAHQGNISRTADALGVERSNLYKKMRAFGIAPSRRELE